MKQYVQLKSPVNLKLFIFATVISCLVITGSAQYCKEGQYSTEEDPHNCKDCPDGTWSWVHRLGVLTCGGCGKGKYLADDRTCNDCEFGYFNDKEIASKCLPCPEGTTSSMFSGRIKCYGCGKGRYMAAKSVCSDCFPGSYSTKEIALDCTRVPPGYEFTKIDLDPKPCGDGFYSSGGRSDCAACPNNNCATIQIDAAKENLIKQMIAYSEYAYDTEKSLSDPNLQDIKLIHSDYNNSLALIGYDKEHDSIIISYRGTSNISNVISDAQFTKDSIEDISHCSGCKVHSGFKSGFQSLDGKMQNELKLIQDLHPLSKIVVTGHSYGGALATLKAISLSNSGFKVSLITFGSPRVGNDKFSAYANNNISGDNIRVTYADDPVSLIPPASFGFKHVGTEIQFYNHNQYYSYPIDYDRENNAISSSFSQHSSYWDIFKDKKPANRFLQY